jgi:circadian clock protein KaiB
VIDVLKKPALAKADQIVAIPTLLRIFPEPARRVLGDLSNLQGTLAALDLCSV